MTLTDTQEQILDATMQCIVRGGIDGASLRGVAKEAEVSLGLLSYHFGDRRSLIESAFQLATDRLLEGSLDSIREADSAEDQVATFIRASFDDPFLTSDYLALRLALWAIARTDPHIAAIEKSLSVRYSHQLSSLISEARAELSVEDATDRATDVIATQNGLWLNWARHRNERDLARGLNRCEQIALGRS